MKTLDELKEAFLELYPAEENAREQRLRIAQGKCENCGKGGIHLEQHHCIEGKLRRTFFERVFTTRMVGYNCHHGSGEAVMISKFRKEVEAILLQDFEIEDVLTICGRAGLTL